jgi:hypothetical protein
MITLWSSRVVPGDDSARAIDRSRCVPTTADLWLLATLVVQLPDAPPTLSPSTLYTQANETIVNNNNRSHILKKKLRRNMIVLISCFL